MNKIFLSHSSAQKNLVQKLADKLGRDRVIYDSYSFETGLDTLSEILKNLEKTDIFVVLLSEEALNSNWVKAEITEAKHLHLIGNINQILPIIIDTTITHKDSRIPDWIKRLNLKTLIDRFLIEKKINQKERELTIENNISVKAKESIFIGRNLLMEEFENATLVTGNKYPICYVASGIEGVGRRTFMRKALEKTKFINENYLPISINLDAKESIEDFILKIEGDLEGSIRTETLARLSNSTFDEKINIAIASINKLIENREKLFIVDFGCIVKPNKHIADWFVTITQSDQLINSLSLILITRFRPNPAFIQRNNKIKSIHVDALSESDREKLFVQYSHALEITMNEDDANFLLDNLNGIPSQVYFALDFVKQTNTQYVRNNIHEVIEYGENKVLHIIETLIQHPEKINLLVLISKFDFISFELLYKIVGKTKEIDSILEEFFLLGIYDTLGGFADNIRVNYTVSDYIRRSKFTLLPIYKQKLRKILKAFLEDGEQNYDASELLTNVKSALEDNVKLPEKYYVPSFVLKSIVNLYYEGKSSSQKYKQVISLADKILENNRTMEKNMEREIRYWLCLALARERNIRFEKEVPYIDGADYKFLLGFYNRMNRNYEAALKYYEETLDISPGFNRAKRELVNVLLSINKYTEALDTARQNYKNNKTNAFHIQAYFMCLIRKKSLSTSDKEMIITLLEGIKRTNERKADEIYDTMLGEYEYYVNHDSIKAIQVLKDSLNKSQYKFYPYKALYDIYYSTGQYSSASDLSSKYEKNTVMPDTD